MLATTAVFSTGMFFAVCVVGFVCLFVLNLAPWEINREFKAINPDDTFGHGKKWEKNTLKSLKTKFSIPNKADPF